MSKPPQYNGTMTRQLIIRLSVPEELDPHQILWCMGDDFFYANRHSEDIGPHLDSITFEVLEESDVTTGVAES